MRCRLAGSEARSAVVLPVPLLVLDMYSAKQSLSLIRHECVSGRFQIRLEPVTRDSTPVANS